jgi:H+/Cl- antiporter ClcA
MPSDPFAMLRTRSYIVLIVLAAILGVPIAAGAHYFLWFIDNLQEWVFRDLPDGLGFDGAPTWWPVLPLTIAGLIVGATIRYLPGTGGHSPADGFRAGGGPAPPIELWGILVAALASLGLGAVVGPEAPLIALGGGIAALALRLSNRDAPAQALVVVGAAGSFAAVAALLGNPLLGAFLMMEIIGLGGPTATLVLLPGLVAAGVGALVFIGLGSITGFGAFSLAVPNLPPYSHPDGAEFAWALPIGIATAFLGTGIRRLALLLRPHVERRMVLLTPIAGLAVAGLAIGYAEATDKNGSDVLFSGQTALPQLVNESATYTVATLLLLIVCKGLAYGVSLSSFRGGPIFPAMYLGAAGGIALSHAPGLRLVPAVAMGIGAMSVVMLRMPVTSVLLATLLMGSDGLGAMPVVIAAVVVAFVISAWLVPQPIQAEGQEDEPKPVVDVTDRPDMPVGAPS